MSDQMKMRLWWRKDRVTVVPDGVDTQLFYPQPQTEARERLGWGQEERIVLFNASIDPIVKGFDLAKAAIDIARQICGDIRWVVLRGDVQPENIPLVMSAADCLLFTSKWEGSPNVIKEAIACGLPVVSVDVGDVRERLVGVDPSFIVERDAETLGKALAQILVQRRRSNGAGVIAGISGPAIAERVLSVYESVFP